MISAKGLLESYATGRTIRVLDDGEVPAIGAHLVTPWFGFTHHGIHVGEGRVVHYGALMYDIIRRPVEEVSLAQFALGRPVFVVQHAEDCLHADDVVRRARSRLGENRYRLLTNNCEHFVEWCLHDAPRSFQAETALAYPRMVSEWFRDAARRAVLRLLAPFTRRRPTILPSRVPE